MATQEVKGNFGETNMTDALEGKCQRFNDATTAQRKHQCGLTKAGSSWKPTKTKTIWWRARGHVLQLWQRTDIWQIWRNKHEWAQTLLAPTFTPPQRGRVLLDGVLRTTRRTCL
ncbi:MAG: hypothetical protein GY941_20775 [Planctomycetes bacterium]|nr:hypothetical protein [Planctomycetota bacterium]